MGRCTSGGGARVFKGRAKRHDKLCSKNIQTDYPVFILTVEKLMRKFKWGLYRIRILSENHIFQQQLFL